jgi:hypothetical protein
VFVGVALTATMSSSADAATLGVAAQALLRSKLEAGAGPSGVLGRKQLERCGTVAFLSPGPRSSELGEFSVSGGLM